MGISNVNNTYECQLIEVHFKNNELIIDNRLFFNDLNNLPKAKINNYCPIILFIEGENIINKVVENKVGYKNDLIFKANPTDFHFFEYHQDQTLFISITRKEYINTILKQIGELQTNIIHLTFGPFVMANLLPLLKDYKEVSTSHYTLEICNGRIESYSNLKTVQREYQINGDVFNQGEIPLIASFLDYKYPNQNIEFDREFLDANKKELSYKNKFKNLGVFTLGFFLITLALSHFLLNFYMESLAKKESLNVVAQQTMVKIDDLKDEKELKERILASSGINNNSFLTRYFMDIGNSIPQNIVLNTIQVIPPINKAKALEKINLDISIIKIIGECENNIIFNNWIKRLKTLKWIKKLDIETYSQETLTENTFTIIIKI